MKLRTLFFAALFIASCAEATTISSNEIHLLGSFVEGKQVNYIVSKNDIANIPEWSGEGEPMIGNEVAAKLAIEKHRSKFGDIATEIRKIQLSSKSTDCSKKQSCPTKLWYYKVKIKGEQRATYIILMDGQFVEPS